MLLLPFVAAVASTGARWPHLPLLGAWLAGYLLSYYALQAIKTRRPGRFRAQLLVYAAIALPLGMIVVVDSPRVAWFAPGYAALLAVNAGYALARRERALVNDLASVAQSCLMVPVAAVVAGTGVPEVTGVFLAVLLYLAGTVLYVKTMIRERGNPAYRRASIAYHVLALAAAVWLGPAVAAVFALLLGRAWLLGGRRIAPKYVGMIEIAASALLLAAIVVTA